jgi:hypothetical protein
MKKVNKEQFNLAKTNLHKVTPALEALHKLEADGYFTKPSDIEKLSEFESWLSGCAAGLVATVNAGIAQYNNRPQNLITSALLRANDIKTELNLLRINCSGLVDNHAEKTEALLKQKFSAEEIKVILPYPTDQIESNAALLITLQDQHDRLVEFTNDSPGYDISMIEGIDLGYHLIRADYHSAQKGKAA